MKLLQNIKLKRKILGGIFFICVFMLIAFVEKRHNDKEIKKIEVRVDYDVDNYFIDEELVLQLITNDGRRRLLGETYDEVNLKELENTVKSYKFVKNAQVFRDYNGKLVIKIDQKRPIARIIRKDSPHGYIDESGEILPLSDRYTTRVLVIDGSFADTLLKDGYLQTETGKMYHELFTKIDSDKFWKAQLPMASVDRYGEISFMPQVGGHKIIFGGPNDVDNKLKKLKIFYKEILPSKGWNKYLTVNLKYKNQLICE